MQLTNILRDIGMDAADLNRIYIPVSLMEKWNYKEEFLINQVVNDDFINMWESLAEVSEHLYDNFLTELKYYKPEAQLPLLVSINVYKEILNEIRENQYDCFTKKHAVSFDKKIILKKKSAQYISRKL
jgi:phytoene synthase